MGLPKDGNSTARAVRGAWWGGLAGGELNRLTHEFEICNALDANQLAAAFVSLGLEFKA